jgi:VanZ family protein
MLEYGLFGWLLTRALAMSRDFRSFAALALWVLFLGGLYGVSDEWHQSFVPLRESSIFDWMADTAGVAAGIGVWLKRKVLPHAHY